ncbi:hypothetical protein SLEP1_g12199 [Rubroshorea leprosula]|uniref:Sodium channel modifier 1 n=1 Tax=Rubroshorea leprosula TaxID=152421 RepID=A0AAV5IME8_9ROSI|nr:hypothetical protein SLEP1_g12199 [Rubroshorea leprosula]
MAISSATRRGSRRYPPRGWRFSEYSYPWGGDGVGDKSFIAIAATTSATAVHPPCLLSSWTAIPIITDLGIGVSTPSFTSGFAGHLGVQVRTEEGLLFPVVKIRTESELEQRGRRIRVGSKEELKGMSVFGGDSWAREAQHRKRRVDDVVIEGIHASSYKKLSNGKYACLVCPQNPILDTPLMLSMHCKGSRHRAAESKLKERELVRRDEVNKRIALADSPIASATSTSNKKVGSVSKPLIQQTRKAASEIFSDNTPKNDFINQNQDSGGNVINAISNISENHSFIATAASESIVVQQQLDFCERRERELKFTAAGWKRDCHGKWYKDENVEFDSDEEDPNVTLG